MEYGYSFDNESPRYALNSLWFLLGVMVFAFSVLIMSAIVSSGGNGSYYLNVHEQPAPQTRPATTNRGSADPVQAASAPPAPRPPAPTPAPPTEPPLPLGMAPRPPQAASRRMAGATHRLAQHPLRLSFTLRT